MDGACFATFSISDGERQVEVKTIKGRIKRAAEKHGVEISTD